MHIYYNNGYKLRQVEHLCRLSTMQQEKERFISAVSKFMEMEKRTAPLRRELIGHIDVYETEGN